MLPKTEHNTCTHRPASCIFQIVAVYLQTQVVRSPIASNWFKTMVYWPFICRKTAWTKKILFLLLQEKKNAHFIYTNIFLFLFNKTANNEKDRKKLDKEINKIYVRASRTQHLLLWEMHCIRKQKAQTRTRTNARPHGENEVTSSSLSHSYTHIYRLAAWRTHTHIEIV